MAIVQQITASMGVFDQRSEREPRIEHNSKHSNKAVKQQVSAMEYNSVAEKEQHMSVLKSIFGRDDDSQRKERESVNVEKAIRQLKSTDDQLNRKRKLQHSKSGKVSRKGKGKT